MIYLRVSTIESYRSILAGEWGQEDDSELVERIRRGQWSEGGEVKWQMEAGVSWHSLLSDPYSLSGDIQADEWMEEGIYSYQAGDVNDAKLYIGEGLWEVTGRREFLPGVMVEGTADWIRGLIIQDNKTCFSTPDARRYERSLQWRFYSLIHDVKVFRYNLWDMSDPKEGRCQLRGVTSCRFFPYPQMEADCIGWLKRLLDWADSKGLIPCLEKGR